MFHFAPVRNMRKSVVFFLVLVLTLIGSDSIVQKKPTVLPPKAEATYQFTPTAGTIITGSNPAILGATAAATEGVNMGDYRGFLLTIISTLESPLQWVVLMRIWI